MTVEEKKTEIIGIRVTIQMKSRIKKLCIEKGYKNMSECIRNILEKNI